QGRQPIVCHGTAQLCRRSGQLASIFQDAAITAALSCILILGLMHAWSVSLPADIVSAPPLLSFVPQAHAVYRRPAPFHLRYASPSLRHHAWYGRSWTQWASQSFE